MKSFLALLLVCSVLISAVAPAAAAVNIQRTGSENPVMEVAKSTLWGALGGLVIGGAIALATSGDSNDGEVIRWSIVAGTAIGLGYGIYQVRTRPAARALLEIGEGKPSLAVPTLAVEPAGGARVTLVGARF